MIDSPMESQEQPATVSGHARAWRRPALLVACLIGLIASLVFFYRGVDWTGKELARPEQAQPAAAQPSIATTTAPETIVAAKPKNRSGLASTISPDGVWRLGVEVAGSPDISIEHTLVLRKVSGTGKKILATVVDDLNPQTPSLAVHAWEAAGWSPDGATVYYANRTIGMGAGSDDLTPGVYGNELYSVSVQGTKATRLAIFTIGEDVQKNGLMTVAPAAKRAAFVDNGSLYTAAFDGSGKKLVYAPREGQRVWQAMYDPSGTKLAVLLMEQKGEEYVWTAGSLDGKGGFTSIGASINGGLLDWTKSSGLAYLDMHPDGSFAEKLVNGAK